MQDDSPLSRAMAMVADLRDRCEWDRAQTRATLAPYLIEEAHELATALAHADRAAIRDEVSDLMLHLAWQLVLGAELDEFTADDIANALVDKMQRRHPHLFGLGDRQSWSDLKRRERGAAGTLDGIPASLPPLLAALRLQERAAGVGFDWADAQGPIAKVREELAEVEAELERGAASHPALADELGDLLFAVVNLARKVGVNPGTALQRANAKFRHRFSSVEGLAAARGIELEAAGLTVLDALWDEVKRAEPKTGSGTP